MASHDTSSQGSVYISKSDYVNTIRAKNFTMLSKAPQVFVLKSHQDFPISLLLLLETHAEISLPLSARVAHLEMYTHRFPVKTFCGDSF